MLSLIAADWLRDHWWVFLVRGIAALAFGVIAVFWPALSLAALILLFGAFALVDGAFTLVAAAIHREANWGWHLVDGVAGVILGIITFAWPDVTGLVLLYFIAAWAIIFGAIRLVLAIRTRHIAEHPWLLGIAGLASVIFGIGIVVLPPVADALAIVWIIGTYAVFIGIVMLAIAIRLRISPRPTIAVA